MPHAKGLAKKKRAVLMQVIDRDGLNCFYCDVPTDLAARAFLNTLEGRKPDATTLDHIIPRSQDGPLCAANAVVACLLCNEGRGNTPFTVFLRRMRES